MVRDRRLQRAEGPIVEERQGGLQVPERRGAEGVSQRRIPLGLLEAKVLVLAGTIEDRIASPNAKHRGDLGTADAMGFKSAEHLVCLTANGMAGHAVRLAEEEQRAALLA